MNESTQSWDPFVLLLIDVQKDFMTEEVDRDFPNYSANVKKLLKFCRMEGIDIVHLRASFQADKSDWMVRYHFLERIPCIEGTPGAALLSCADDVNDEKVIIKQTFDGFQNPQLQEYLTAGNKQYLLIAGLVTSVCVLLTAASAAQQGYLVSLVEDCCADKAEAHKHTLARYPFIFDRTLVDEIQGRRAQWLEDLEKVRSI